MVMFSYYFLYFGAPFVVVIYCLLLVLVKLKFMISYFMETKLKFWSVITSQP